MLNALLSFILYVSLLSLLLIGRFVIIGQMDKSSKAHSRIIWSCGWSHDDACFATASRDKRV